MFLQLGRLRSEIKAAEAWEEFGVSVATSPRSWVPFGSVLAHDELQKVAEGACQPGATALCPESSPGPKQEWADAAGHRNAAPCPVLLGLLRLHVEKTPQSSGTGCVFGSTCQFSDTSALQTNLLTGACT